MIGTALSHFAITAQLGEGGMGRVYLATDLKLGRDVAVKVLSEELAEDREHLRRFEREGKTLASLNHPNIAAIYDVGRVESRSYIVMELVRGEDLATRLRRGPLSVSQTIDVCGQIATGLEAAHETGVVHRDLKPANIRITPDGTVKLLDFGLAKPMPLGAAPTSVETTESLLVTAEGRVLGTPTYMSPEQARGRPLDRRCDIWAFGCVCFECLVGFPPFRGPTFSDVVASILDREPDWGVLPTDTPGPLRALIARCLIKAERGRLRDIGEARVLLEDPDARTAGAEPYIVPPQPARRFGQLTMGTVLGLVAGSVLAATLWLSTRDPPPTPPPRLQVELPPPAGTTYSSLRGPVALSPSGIRLAFVAQDDQGEARLFVRDMTTGAVHPLPGTEEARYPFWSADGRALGFVVGKDLYITRTAGGRPSLLVENAAGPGGAWAADGTILFGGLSNQPLQRVHESGGAVDVVFDKDPSQTAEWAMWPSFLPGGRRFLVAVQDALSGESEIYVGSLDSTEKWKLEAAGSNPAYLASGHLVYVREQVLYARTFHPATLELGAVETPVLHRVAESSWPRYGLASTAPTGRIVYFPGGESGAISDLVWFDRRTGSLEEVGVTGTIFNPRLSHGGSHVAFDRTSPRTSGDIWVRDLVRGTEVRLTHGPTDDSWPVWAPDDRDVFFFQTPDLYRAPAHASSEPLLVLQTGNSKAPCDLTPDGSELIFAETTGRNRDLRVLELATGEVRPWIGAAKFNEWGARLSPDGRWGVYVTNASGLDMVYMASFPTPSQVQVVSPEGGTRPIWSRDGKTIFYASSRGLYSVSVELRGDQRPRVSEPVLEVPFETWRFMDDDTAFDITADGERFLLVRNRLADEGRPLVLVDNALSRLGR